MPPSGPSRRGKPTKPDAKWPRQVMPATRKITPNSRHTNPQLKPSWRKFWLISDETVRSLNYTDDAYWWRRMATESRIYTAAPDARAKGLETLNSMTTMNVLTLYLMWTLRCTTTGWIQIRWTTKHTRRQVLSDSRQSSTYLRGAPLSMTNSDAHWTTRS